MANLAKICTHALYAREAKVGEFDQVRPLPSTDKEVCTFEISMDDRFRSMRVKKLWKGGKRGQL